MWWAFRQNPEDLLAWWNSRVKLACDVQDERVGEETLTAPLERRPEKVVSHFDAWSAPTRWVPEFHRLVAMYHREIRAEVESEVKNIGRNLSSDAVAPHPLLEEEKKWNPLWVKFLGRYGSGVPTLRAISSMFPEVHSLYVSVFYPGTMVADHNGISRSLHRYHYGLRVPEGEAGIEIGGKRIRWKEKEGFVWDPTVTHSAWNRTEEPCILIVADIERDLKWQNLGTHFVYWLLRLKGGWNLPPSEGDAEEPGVMPEWSPQTEEAVSEVKEVAAPPDVADDE